ncbi:MAG: YraN family protein [Alphaproteobacteria bacterium]
MTSRPAPGPQVPKNWGRRAESLPALMLRLKGYTILADCCRCPVGEIDLVKRRVRSTAMVEVKVGASAEDAAFAGTPHQQHRIARAAEHFLSANPGHMGFQLRFDATLAVHDARRID